MGSLFNNLAIIYDNNPVCVHNGGESMSRKDVRAGKNKSNGVRWQLTQSQAWFDLL